MQSRGLIITPRRSDPDCNERRFQPPNQDKEGSDGEDLLEDRNDEAVEESSDDSDTSNDEVIEIPPDLAHQTPMSALR